MLKKIIFIIPIGFIGIFSSQDVFKPISQNLGKVFTTFYSNQESITPKKDNLVFSKISKSHPKTYVYKYQLDLKKEKKLDLKKEKKLNLRTDIIRKDYESFKKGPDFWMENWTKLKIKWLDGDGKKFIYYTWKTYGDHTYGSQIRRLFWILKNKDPYYLNHPHMGKMSYEQQFNWMKRLLNYLGFLK